MLRPEISKAKTLWRILAAILAPFVIVSVDLLGIGLLYHGSGNHSTTPAFIIGIAVGGFFVLALPLPRFIRILCLFLYVPVIWALLIPYSLWFIGVLFHGMISGG